MSHLPLDQARLRPHLRQQPAKRKRTPVEAEADETTTSPGWKTPVGGDLERLRGLPAVGPNIRGSIRGTDPVSETIRRSERHSRGR